jgi:hypothetical protein
MLLRSSLETIVAIALIARLVVGARIFGRLYRTDILVFFLNRKSMPSKSPQ